MKKLSILLALALLLTVFAGCQGRNNGLRLPITDGAQSNVETVSQEAAQQIALDHAGLKIEDVAGLHTQIDYDDGRSHYDVEFHSGDFAYSYEVDSFGKVIKSEKDYEPLPPVAPAAPTVQPTTPAEPAVQPAAPTAPTTQATGVLTKEDAQKIALEHAGLTVDSVRFLKVEFDREDNIYEVEFSKDGFEYNYEIHAASGKILEADKDRDD